MKKQSSGVGGKLFNIHLVSAFKYSMFFLAVSFFVCVFFPTWNTWGNIIRRTRLQSMWEKNNNNATSAGRDAMRIETDNRRPSPPPLRPTGRFGAFVGNRSADAAAALRLSSEEKIKAGVRISRPSPRRLPPPQAIRQKCAATLSSRFFSTLKNNNPSYCYT